MIQERKKLESVVVAASQMRQIEERLFEAGMPVAALMEKVGIAMARRIQELYPNVSQVGIIVGPGHNGGDALVIARELSLQGYDGVIYQPLSKLKELTAQHANYASHFGIPFVDNLEALHKCDLIIDGLFGFGLTRSLEGEIADTVNSLNQWSQPIISLDLPSGIHTDTGEALGTAVKATHTFCIGLWKRAFFQDQALEYIGKPERIDFGIPPGDVWAIISQPPQIQCITSAIARNYLPLPRPPVTHKYKQGHLLVIGGSRRYAGGVILTALAARASGVGMLSVAVPESLKSILVSQLPEALIIGCPETEDGVIAELPPLVSNWDYDAIACGPGITPQATPMLQEVLRANLPLVLDADGLNILAELGTRESIAFRNSPTILTPHPGEFKRLFPNAPSPTQDQIKAAQEAAKQSGAIVILKVAKSVVAHPEGAVWVIPESTPALARGGSGDVLTGLIGGLIAPSAAHSQPLEALVATAAWWHAQSAILAASKRTEMGVDAFTLCQYLIPLLSREITP